MGCSATSKAFEDLSESKRLDKSALSKDSRLQSVQMQIFEEIGTSTRQLLILHQAKKAFYNLLNLDAFFFRKKTDQAFHGFLFHLRVNGKDPRYTESVPYLKLDSQSNLFRVYEYYVSCLDQSFAVLMKTVHSLTQVSQQDLTTVVSSTDILTEQEWARTKKKLHTTIKTLRVKLRAIADTLTLFQSLAKATLKTEVPKRLSSLTLDTGMI